MSHRFALHLRRSFVPLALRAFVLFCLFRFAVDHCIVLYMYASCPRYFQAGLLFRLYWLIFFLSIILSFPVSQDHLPSYFVLLFSFFFSNQMRGITVHTAVYDIHTCIAPFFSLTCYASRPYTASACSYMYTNVNFYPID